MTTTEPDTCRRCGHPLAATRSRDTGYGPACWRRHLAHIAAQYADHQVAKALELLDLGALVPLRGNRVFLVRSGDGARTYRTHPAACTCPSGVHGRGVCKHRIAAHLLAA